VALVNVALVNVALANVALVNVALANVAHSGCNYLKKKKTAGNKCKQGTTRCKITNALNFQK
jgi:hypothetical protein